MKGKKKKRINNEGFTLVELLATISVLAIIMLIAIPNVVGVVQKSKIKTYIEDAKKMVVLAKYRVRTDNDVKEKLTKKNDIVQLTLNQLDTGNEIKDAPNGGEYDRKESFVEIKKNSNSYSYTVTLLEIDEERGSMQGLKNVDSDKLDSEDAYKEVEIYQEDSSNY